MREIPETGHPCRIVGWEEFAKLPSGTLCAHWEPSIVSETFVKGDTIFSDGEPIDFFYVPFGADTGFDKHGCPDPDKVVVDDIGSRWGLFEFDALFIVYPKSGIEFMIDQLKKCLEVEP